LPSNRVRDERLIGLNATWQMEMGAFLALAHAADINKTRREETNGDLYRH
jgi:hypothetical protein